MHRHKVSSLAMLCLLFCSCSLMTKVGVKTIAPSLKKSSVAIQYEHDWDHFQESVLSQLKILEMLNEIEPENTHLLESLIKGYSGLGFGVYETLYLEDQIKDRDSVYQNKASDAYSRAIYYAQKYFQSKGADWKVLEQKMNDQKSFNQYMSSHFSNSDLVALFYTTQAMASLININRDKVVLMSKINLALNMLNWVCAEDPTIEGDMCVLFQAGMLASRPRMLGGNPKVAAKKLKAFFKTNPDNSLGKIFYLQYIAIPQDNEKEFNQIMKTLKAYFVKFDKSFIYPQRRPTKMTNLFNAIAKKRYEIMKKNKKELF